MRRIIWLLLGGILAMAAVGVATNRPSPLEPFSEHVLGNGAAFVPEKCWFNTDKRADVQCGYMHVAPSTAFPSSAFQLPVIVMRYTGKDRKPDPLVYLSGGPGAASWLDSQSIESYWLDWFRKKEGMQRDLILFDQRGTGMSKPAIHCPEYRELSANVLTSPGTPEQNAGRYREVTEQCRSHLLNEGMPLAELGTERSAADVNDLLALLGYEQANLLGVSYGTRLALEVQRQFPSRVRSLSLDSIYPPGEHLFRDWPDLLGKSIQRIFRQCNLDSRCQLENGDIHARYAALMGKLRQNPMLIPVGHLHLGKLQSLKLNDEILLAILFDAQYMSHSLQGLPDMIRYLQEDRPDLAMHYIESYLHHQFDDSFSEPVFWSVECNDNPPIPRRSMEERVNAYPELRYYLPHDYDVCDVWKGDHQPAGLQQPEAPRQTPALILSGEDDPITPTAWAMKAAENDFNPDTTYLFRFANIAHSVLDNKDCANDLFISFINLPGKRPSADCRFDDGPGEALAAHLE
ncbi:MAG: alpha/beta hydrolase [Gammaproteobacteria bacterium]|nr:alpha/beta hydrolase [Gammaproteobacteria bacterium]MBU1724316.1 alpha/beta hydrolase [Gammaproteobacteria bacterium]MBU2006256.1 alpha/beta hydrolase [Gammaproteobacteria bacterium]